MILVLIHILLLIAILRKIPLFVQSGVPILLWVLLLGVKAVVGYAVIVYYDMRYGSSDMRDYLLGANTVFSIFMENPAEGVRLFVGAEPGPGTIARMKEYVPFWFGRPYSDWFNDSRNFIRLQSVLRFVSDGNIWIHLLWTNLVSLVGGMALIRFFMPATEKVRVPFVAIGLLFIPNGLLWSSTVLKEPFLLLALGFTLLAFRKWLDSGLTSHRFFLLLSLFFFLMIKPFWLMALLPGLIAWAVYHRKPSASAAVAGSYILALLIAMSVGMISSDIHLPSLLFGEQRNMWRFAVFGGAGSLIEPVGFAPTWISVFKHIPGTLALTMSQPVPSGWSDWPGLFLFSENILFLVLFAANLIQRRALVRILTSPSLMLACCSGFIIVLVSGFTTPVAGTLIRYRWPGVLLLMMAFCTAWLADYSSRYRASTDERQD